MQILQSYRKLDEAERILTNTKFSVLHDVKPSLESIKNWLAGVKILIDEAELLLLNTENEEDR